MVMTAAVSSPNALTHAVPDSDMKSRKMHQPRSMRWPVFSRTGGSGGADAGCFEWTAIALRVQREAVRAGVRPAGPLGRPG